MILDFFPHSAAPQMSTIKPSLAGALLCGLTAFVAHGGQLLSGSNLRAEFGDSATGWSAGNTDRLDRLEWVDSNGSVVSGFVANSGSACGDARIFFGQAYGEPEGTSPLAVGPGAANTAADVTASTLRSIGSQTGSQSGCQTANDTTAQTDYRTFPGIVGKGDILRIIRSFHFSASTPVFNGHGLRAYVPAMPLVPYGKVLIPNAAGSAVNAVDARACGYDCEQVDWNGRWFANDDGTGGGLLVIRDPLSTADALLNVRSDLATSTNRSSIVLLQPGSGWKADVTEIEYLCPYDSLSWPAADRDAGRLPLGCTVDRPAYEFGSITDAAKGSSKVSRALTVGKLTAPATIAVTGGRYSINGAAFTARTGSVMPGDSLRLQVVAAAAPSTRARSLIDIDGKLGVFSVTTAADAGDGRSGAKSETNATTAAVPTLSVADVSITEGNSGTKNLVFTATLSPAATVTVTVRATTVNGTAISGSDFNGGTQTLTFLAGETTKMVGIGIRGDLVSEADETFFVNLDNPTGGAVIGRSQAVGTIINDDGVVTDTTPDAFSFTAANGVGLSSVQTSNAITVSGINAASPISVTGGSYSLNGGAYTTAAGTVTVGQTVTVQQTASSSFNTLSTATLTIGGVSAPYAVTTLAADTTPDAFSFGALTGVAAGSVQTSEAITVSGINSGSPISIVGGSYSLNSGDYTTAAGTVLAGQTVRVQQTASTSLATTTTATLTIGGVSAPFSVTTQQPALSINDVSIAEGNSGISNMVFTVSLNGAAPTPVSVDYATADGTAQAGSDYTAGSGTVSFPAGTTSQTITVAILGDTVVEPSETVLVNLSNPVGASLADPQGVGTIVSDDLAGPTLSISDASTTEGNSGTKALTFTATLSPAATTTVTVRATTANGTATSGSDYTGGALTLTFAPGETSKSASISIRGDTVVEPDETFFVNLTAPTGGAVIGRAQATGTIINDDAASDTTPDPFSFSPVTDVAPNSVQTSNAIVVAGINAASPISVTGGSYNINGGAYTTLAGTVTVGQSITVRQTASASPGTTTTAMLTIGGVSAAYAVTTQAADTTPDSFSFTPTTDVALSSIQTSNAVTISGINSASPVSITAGGSYSINDGVYTDQPGTITAGQTLKVRQTASASNGTSTTVTVTVGGVSAGYTVTTIATALDTTPDAFSFTPVANAAPGSTQTSNAISVTGINAPAPISISGDPSATYSINGSLFTAAAGTVFTGDTVTVQVQASSVSGESRVADLAIGDVTGAYTVTTVGPDSSPDPFFFRSANKALFGSVQFSGPTLITGYNVPTPISIVGGTYRINAPPPVDGVHDDSGYTTEPGTLMPGDTVGVRALASDQPSTMTIATVTIGDGLGTFTVTTEVADSTPRSFSFASRFNVEPGRTQVSDAILVTRINIPTPISVLNGSYSINGGAFTSVSGQVRAGDSVRVAVIASTAYSTSSAATLTIGDTSASFTVVTVAADNQPDSFAFGVVSGVAPGSLQSSQPVMLTGITVQSPISIVGGSYSINGGDFRSDASNVNPGDAIVVRLTAAPDFGASRTATVTVANRNGAFTVITRSADTMPDPFSFAPVVNAVAGAVQVSNPIVVSGIEAPAAISLSGDTSGAYRINGGAYTNIPGTVRNGDTVDLRLRAPATAASGTSMSLAIGGISAAFTVATPSSAPGTAPDPFVFAAIDGAMPSSLQISNPITISGIAAAVTISVSGDASAQYSVNGGAFTSAKGTAVAGDVIRLRLQASASPSTTISAKFSAGATRASFFVATLTPDTSPDAFVFNSLAGVVRGSIQTSNAVTIGGINTPAAIGIVGGRYSVNGAPFTSAAGLVSNGATVVVQVAAATDADAQTQATLTVGSLSASFSVSTEAADAMPDPLVLFGPATTFPVLAQNSNTMVISGINTAVPVSISGGSYSRNGAPFTTAGNMVNNGDTLAVQVMAPAIVGRSATVTIVVGAGASSVSAAYSVTAAAPVDTVPDPFAFTALFGVALQSEQVSAPITLFGNSSPSPVSIVGGQYSINGGPYVADAGSILAGDQLSVKVIASRNFNARATATLTVSGVSAAFSVTTLPSPATRPAPFALTRVSSPDNNVDLSYSLPGTVITSNTVTLSNVDAPVPISITGGTYSIDGGPYTSAAGSVGNGARVTVQMVLGPLFNATTTARLVVGNVSATLSEKATSNALSTTPTTLSGAETYIYRSSNLPDVPLRIHVFKPVGWRAEIKRPAYLFFFGGGWVTGTPSTSRMSFATDQGMVGFAIDYRTNQRFGTTPLEAVADARAALRWVQDHADQFGIDPARIVVSGSSAGGHLALWTAIGMTPVGSEAATAPLYPPAALTLSSPVSDSSPALGYRPDRFGVNAEALSPVSHLDVRMPPLIVHHGDLDVTVAQSRSVALCNALVAGNNVCEFHNVAGASHSFSDVPESFAQNDNQVAEFLLQQGVLPAVRP